METVSCPATQTLPPRQLCNQEGVFRKQETWELLLDLCISDTWIFEYTNVRLQPPAEYIILKNMHTTLTSHLLRSTGACVFERRFFARQEHAF